MRNEETRGRRTAQPMRDGARALRVPQSSDEILGTARFGGTMRTRPGIDEIELDDDPTWPDHFIDPEEL